MSKPFTEQITCPDCKHQYDFTCWESLNATLNPKEKEQLLSGDLFNTECPACHTTYQVVYSILYHDMDHKVMTWLILNDEDIDSVNSFIKSANGLEIVDDLTMAGYKYRFVRTQDELREKALIFDCGLDDRVIEFLKVIYYAQFHDEKPDEIITQMYFFNEPSYRIIIFVEGSSATYSIDLSESLHNEILEDKRSLFDEKSNGALFVDREWAISFFTRQQNESEDTV